VALTPGKRCVGLLLAALLAVSAILHAQGLRVTGRVTLIAAERQSQLPDNSNTVVWLTPVPGAASSQAGSEEGITRHYRLVQRNKRFIPHILVVPVGAAVEFPNQDPFFHNVFSMFNGKRFDLGLYEAGSTRTVTFNSPGVSYIFCNIHPEMSAVVIVAKTPYYGISNAAGDITIAGVPPGRYELNVWQERCLPAALKRLSREVTISPSSTSLSEMRLPESGDVLSKHKNLYGRDYDSKSSSYPNYDQP
jgi:plastocyanin